MEKQDLDTITYSIIGASYEVRKVLGKHLHEDIYEEALQVELKLRGIESKRQAHVPVFYKGIRLERNYRVDLLVENTIPIELKALDTMGKLEFGQLMSYLVFGNFEFGFLINFHAVDFSTARVAPSLELPKGIYRIFNSDTQPLPPTWSNHLKML